MVGRYALLAIFCLQFFVFKGLAQAPEDKTERLIIVLRKPVNLLGAPSLKFIQRQNQRALYRFLQNHSQFHFQNIQPLWIVNGFVADVPSNQVSELQQSSDLVSLTDAHLKVYPNFEVSLNIRLAFDFEQNLKSIGVDRAQKKYPKITGAGVVVGILDSGIGPQHPDLKGKLIAYKNFSPSKVETPEDPREHGTHVSGIAVGGDRSGRQIGVAPEAQIVFARIFDNNFDSSLELILKALEWMTDPSGDGSGKNRPRVINASWGSTAPYKDRDPSKEPYCLAFKTLLQLNVIPVVAAGNNGPKPMTTNLPGGCPEAFTVGATDNWDRSPWFSAEGPTVWVNQQLVKPDVVAPGLDIRSSAGAYSDYEKMSGTSMSAPHVTGAFALLLQKAPHLSVLEAQDIMRKSAKPLGTGLPNNTFGFGRIDVLQMLDSVK
jgi:subtilisin family serine protease